MEEELKEELKRELEKVDISGRPTKVPRKKPKKKPPSVSQRLSQIEHKMSKNEKALEKAVKKTADLEKNNRMLLSEIKKLVSRQKKSSDNKTLENLVRAVKTAEKNNTLFLKQLVKHQKTGSEDRVLKQTESLLEKSSEAREFEKKNAEKLVKAVSSAEENTASLLKQLTTVVLEKADRDQLALLSSNIKRLRRSLSRLKKDKGVYGLIQQISDFSGKELTVLTAILKKLEQDPTPKSLQELATLLSAMKQEFSNLKTLVTVQAEQTGKDIEPLLLKIGELNSRELKALQTLVENTKRVENGVTTLSQQVSKASFPRAVAEGGKAMVSAETDRIIGLIEQVDANIKQLGEKLTDLSDMGEVMLLKDELSEMRQELSKIKKFYLAQSPEKVQELMDKIVEALGGKEIGPPRENLVQNLLKALEELKKDVNEIKIGLRTIWRKKEVKREKMAKALDIDSLIQNLSKEVDLERELAEKAKAAAIR